MVEYQHQILGYECPVKNVTGNSNVKIQNKNLAITNFPDNISLTGSGNNRTVVVSSYKLSQIIKVKPNTTYSINGDYSSISDQRMRIYYFDEYPDINVVSTKYIYSGQSTAYTFTTDATTQYILLFGAVSPLADVVIPNLQIEQGSTATDFVPHAEQNYPFTFAEGQFLADNEKLQDNGMLKKWKQVTFSGTTITLEDAKTNGAYFCNKKVAGNLDGQTLTFDEEVTNAVIQYELAEEEIISYNETQASEYEAIKQAHTYKDVTYISSESDELPPLLDIQYWKERGT